MAKLKKGLEAKVSEIEVRPWNWFKPHPENPREHDAASIQKLADYMKRVGFVGALVARPDGTILAGHKRWQAFGCVDKAASIPCAIFEGTDAEALELILADNRFGEDSTWNDELLAAAVQKLIDQDMDPAGAGFSDDELQTIIGGWKPTVTAEELAGDVAELKAVIKVRCLPQHKDTVKKHLDNALQAMRDGGDIDFGDSLEIE